jgi:hypothetical protein
MASHRMSDRQRARLEAEDQRAYDRKQSAAKRKAVHAARKVVAIWNGRARLCWPVRLRFVAFVPLVVTFTLLLSGEGAKAQTLELMKQNCERLESYWQLDPPSANGVSVPNQAGAAICYGLMLAFAGLRENIGFPGDAANPPATKQEKVN